MARPKTLQNAERLEVRIPAILRARAVAAAEAAGMTLSAFVIDCMRRVIDGESVEVLPPLRVHREGVVSVGPGFARYDAGPGVAIPARVLQSAAAADAPFGKSVSAHLLASGALAGSRVISRDDPGMLALPEHRPVESGAWAARLEKVQRLMEENPGDGWEAWDDLCRVHALVFPDSQWRPFGGMKELRARAAAFDLRYPL